MQPTVADVSLNADLDLDTALAALIGVESKYRNTGGVDVRKMRGEAVEASPDYMRWWCLRNLFRRNGWRLP